MPERPEKERTNLGLGCFIALILAMTIGYLVWWEPFHDAPPQGPTYPAE